jgi:hypothetical protein
MALSFDDVWRNQGVNIPSTNTPAPAPTQPPATQQTSGTGSAGTFADVWRNMGIQPQVTFENMYKPILKQPESGSANGPYNPNTTNLNANGTPYSMVDSMTDSNGQLMYNEGESQLWNTLNGRFRRNNIDPALGAINTPTPGTDPFTQQLVNNGSLSQNSVNSAANNFDQTRQYQPMSPLDNDGLRNLMLEFFRNNGASLPQHNSNAPRGPAELFSGGSGYSKPMQNSGYSRHQMLEFPPNSKPMQYNPYGVMQFSPDSNWTGNSSPLSGGFGGGMNNPAVMQLVQLLQMMGR